MDSSPSTPQVEIPNSGESISVSSLNIPSSSSPEVGNDHLTLIDKSQLEYLTNASIFVFLFSSVVTFASSPETYVNLILTALSGLITLYFVNRKNLSFSQLNKAFSAFLFFNMVGCTLFSLRHASTRMMSGFIFFVYPTLYSPDIKLLRGIASFLSYPMVASLSSPDIFPPILHENKTLLFIQVFTYSCSHIVLATLILFQISPRLKKTNRSFQIFSNRIDSILSHLFPPFIAYLLSKTPLSNETQDQNSLQTPHWWNFSSHNSIYRKHQLDRNVIDTLDKFVQINPDVLEPQISKEIHLLSPHVGEHANPDEESLPLHSMKLILPPPKTLSRLSLLFGKFSSNKTSKVIVHNLVNSVTIFLSFDSLIKGTLSSLQVHFLRTIFDIWDHLLVQFGKTRVDKIKVFETCRMLISLPECPNLSIALELVDLLVVSALNHKHFINSQLIVSIGMSVGPVTAGVWGRTLFQYDIVGAPVNLAARLAFSHSVNSKPVSVNSSISSSNTLESTLNSLSNSTISTISAISASSASSASNDQQNPSPPSSPTLPQVKQPNPMDISFIICETCYKSLQIPPPSTPVCLSLKGIGESVTAYRIHTNYTKSNIQSHHKRSSESLESNSSTDSLFSYSIQDEIINRKILRIPNQRDLRVVRAFIFLYASIILIAILPPLIISPSDNIINDIPLLFTVIIFYLFCGFLLYRQKKIHEQLANKDHDSKLLDSQLETFFRMHKVSYLIFVLLILVGGTLYLSLAGTSFEASIALIFMLSFVSLVLVDHGLFQSEIRKIGVSSALCCFTIILTNLLVEPAPEFSSHLHYYFGSYSNQDFYIFVVSFVILFSIIKPLRQLQDAQISASHLYQNSLHPALQHFLRGSSYNSSIKTPFVFPSSIVTTPLVHSDSQDSFCPTNLSSNEFEQSTILPSVQNIFCGNVAVVYLDIANFTSFCSSHSANEIIALLDLSFSKFDLLARKLDLIKAPTVGDAYIILSNEPGQILDQYELVQRIKSLIVFSELVVQLFAQLVESDSSFSLSRPPLGLRGSVVVGKCFGSLIGSLRPSFQYFGECLDIAKQLQNSAPLNRIHIHKSVFQSNLPLSFLNKFPSMVVATNQPDLD